MDDEYSKELAAIVAAFRNGAKTEEEFGQVCAELREKEIARFKREMERFKNRGGAY